MKIILNIRGFFFTMIFAESVLKQQKEMKKIIQLLLGMKFSFREEAGAQL
jgi:hypothetical protein